MEVERHWSAPLFLSSDFQAMNVLCVLSPLSSQDLHTHSPLLFHDDDSRVGSPEARPVSVQMQHLSKEKPSVEAELQRCQEAEREANERVRRSYSTFTYFTSVDMVLYSNPAERANRKIYVVHYLFWYVYKWWLVLGLGLDIDINIKIRYKTLLECEAVTEPTVSHFTHRLTHTFVLLS